MSGGELSNVSVSSLDLVQHTEQVDDCSVKADSHAIHRSKSLVEQHATDATVQNCPTSNADVLVSGGGFEQSITGSIVYGENSHRRSVGDNREQSSGFKTLVNSGVVYPMGKTTFCTPTKQTMQTSGNIKLFSSIQFRLKKLISYTFLNLNLLPTLRSNKLILPIFNKKPMAAFS